MKKGEDKFVCLFVQLFIVFGQDAIEIHSINQSVSRYRESDETYLFQPFQVQQFGPLRRPEMVWQYVKHQFSFPYFLVKYFFIIK